MCYIKPMKKAALGLSKIILILSGCSLLVVLSAGILYPPHNLLKFPLIPFLVLSCAIVFGLLFFLPKRKTAPDQKEPEFLPILYIILLVAFCGITITVSLLNPLREDSLRDYQVVLANARNIARSLPLETPLYYQMASNNFKPTLLVSAIIRISDFLHINDAAFISCFSCIITTVSVLFTSLLIEGCDRWKYRILLLFLFIFMIPVYVQAGILYTDTMTFGSAVLSIFLIKKAFHAYSDHHKMRSVILAALSGCFAGLGFSLKVTVAIPLFAAVILFIIFLIAHSKEKSLPKGSLFFPLLTVILSFLCMYFSLEVYAKSFEDYRISKNTEEPVIGYIALGLKGDGSFAENSDFANIERYLPTKSEKSEYSANYIRENLNQFYNPAHITRKLNRNFSGGFLGADDFVHYPLNDGNILYHLFDAWGRYYWRASQYCFLYIHLLYSILLSGTIFGIWQINKTKKIPFGVLLGSLTFLGIFLFLMFWEANNRQLYNQMPILCFGIICVIRAIRERSDESSGRQIT